MEPSPPHLSCQPDLYCGNAHFPPNGTRDYDYANTTPATSFCPDWGRFPDLIGETEQVTCQDWGCSDNGWQAYWFGSLPRSEGWVDMVSKEGLPFRFPRNWWTYILYPDQAIAFNRQFESTE